MRNIKRFLLHEKMLIRFTSLLALVLIAFFFTWTLSYLFLPEGLLRGRSAAALLAGNDLAGGSVWLEWLRICAINLVVMFVLVAAPNLLRAEGDFPLGYTTVSLIAVIFGITLGTNSLAFSLGGKLAPTWAILGSSGLYEIVAYVLAAAATTSISRYRLVGRWPKQTLEVIIPPQDDSIRRERSLGIALAIGILLVANGWEAYNISQLFLP